MIAHFKVDGSTELLPFLIEKLNKPSDQIQFLIGFGAIYVNETRVLADLMLRPNSHVRVHANPRRYEVPSSIETVFENESYLVINKPSGLPTHSTLDNWYENALSVMRKQTSKELLVTTRLDIGTSGMLLFAKNKEVQAEINRLVVARRVRKKYWALTEKSVLPQQYIAYMESSKTSPKRMSENNQDMKCETTVCRCDSIDRYSLLELELGTGRTHQIRAHLSYLGAPIVNDVLYGGVENLSVRPHPHVKTDGFNLHCSEMEFESLGQRISVKASTAWVEGLKNKNPQR